MVWFLGVLLVIAYFVGPHVFEIVGILAIIALLDVVGGVAAGMRGMQRNEI